jgi:hypothetical protein
MSVTCKSCNKELSAEYEGEISPDTICPNCGERLVRNFVLHVEAAEFGLTGGTVSFVLTTYPEALITEVKDLIEREKFTLAIVVAQMACEISTERALTRAFEKRQIDEPLREAITKMLSGRSITNGNVRNVYNALTGKDTHQELKDLGIWQGLDTLKDRRNAAVHKGVIWVKVEAEMALETATALVQYFKIA